MNESFDVAIVGGGPCGLAAAIILASLNHRVGVFERKRFGSSRVGETFGPSIAASLNELGVWDDFASMGSIPFRGVRSAWGSSDIVDRPSIVHPLGEGFHVDRAAFDALLVRHAMARGAVLRDEMAVASIEQTPRGWLLQWPNADAAVAKFLIDASGRGAPGTAKGLSERHWVACDRAVAVFGRFADTSGREWDPELLIEAAEQGWWYAVPQPGNSLLCVWMTDSDLLSATGRDELPAQFLAALGQTRHVAALTVGANLIDPPRTVRADTGFLWPNHGPSWLAVGDAAFASDPLSGDGISRGIRTTIEAARRIDAMVSGKTDSVVVDEDKPIRAYLDQRARYYRIERRWIDSLFWKRRHGLDWQSIPISLDPRVILEWDGREPSADTLAPIESLLPPRVLRAMLDRLRKPQPAHVAMTALRDAAPMGDKRLLVGLQALVAAGVVTALD